MKKLPISKEIGLTMVAIIIVAVGMVALQNGVMYFYRCIHYLYPRLNYSQIANYNNYTRFESNITTQLASGIGAVPIVQEEYMSCMGAGKTPKIILMLTQGIWIFKTFLVVLSVMMLVLMFNDVRNGHRQRPAGPPPRGSQEGDLPPEGQKNAKAEEGPGAGNTKDQV
jgi:hypothetical protein